MALNFESLENPIFKILSAPHTDLTTISAKNVRRQLIKEDPSITPEFLRDNKEEIDAIIGRVFEIVNAQRSEGSNDEERRKRKQDEEEAGEEEVDDDEVEVAPVPKKVKKASKNELTDAELARQLSNELNGRSRRASAKPTKPRGGTNEAARKGGRMKKSAEIVDSDDDGEDGGERKLKKKSSRSGGGAKGGFAKEFILRYNRSKDSTQYLISFPANHLQQSLELINSRGRRWSNNFGIISSIMSCKTLVTDAKSCVTPAFAAYLVSTRSTCLE